MARESDFITEARQAARDLWAAILKLEALQSEFNALDYGTTLPDGVGENEGINKAQIGAVVFDTANAMRGVLDAGHATNVAKLL